MQKDGVHDMYSAQYAEFATGRHLCSLLSSLSAAGAWNEFDRNITCFGLADISVVDSALFLQLVSFCSW